MKADKRTREILCLAFQKTEQNKAEKENVNKKNPAMKVRMMPRF